MRRAALTLTAAFLCAAGACLPARAADPRPSMRLGSHSMLQLSDPPALQVQAAGLARQAGMGLIRRDVNLAALYWRPGDPPYYGTLDLARMIDSRFGLQTVATVTGTPWWIAACPPGTPFDLTYKCVPGDWNEYERLLGGAVAHAPEIRYWQVGNEPDYWPGTLRGFWYGTTADYAALLWHSARAIRAANPKAKVVFGGMCSFDRAWLAQVISGSGYDNRRSYDIAAVHRRPRRARDAAYGASDAKAMFAGQGFRGPLWITETGYPSDWRFQTDPAHRGRDRRSGLDAQAGWVADAVPRFWRAGAAAVFLSARDAGRASVSRLDSESFLAWSLPGPGARLAAKPAVRALQRLAAR